MRTSFLFNLILKYLIINLCFVFLITNCSRQNLWESVDNSNSVIDNQEISRSSRDITRFDFLQSDNSGLTSDVSGNICILNIDLSVPQGFNISGLVPDIIINGESITPQNRIPNNFSEGPVAYTVTAKDGSLKVYSVTVDNGPPAAPGAPADTVITPPMKIKLTGGCESDFKEFRYTLSGTPPGNCSEGLTAQVDTDIDIPLSTTTLNAIACDNFGKASAPTTRVYTYSSSSGKDIVKFDFRKSDNTGFLFESDIIGVINQSSSTVDLIVPSGTNINNLVPYIVHTGNVVTPGSGIANDFSSGTINYQVKAVDNSAKVYSVKVHVVTSNIALNGSFEYVSPLCWYTANPGNYQQSIFERVEGGYSMSLVNNGTASIGPLKQDIALSLNTDYILTMSMKLDSGTISGNAIFDTTDVFDDSCQFTLSASDKGKWVHYSCIFNSGSTAQVKLRFFQSDEEILNGTAYLDNVILSKIQ